MTKTATQLIQEAYQDLGGMMPGQFTSTDVLAHGLTAVNELIDAWQIDQLMVPYYPAFIFNLVTGQQTYTVGPLGADFTMARPNNIEWANIILNNVNPVIRQPLRVLCVTYQQWAAIRVQQLPNAIPLILYYTKDFSPITGDATINLWPGPNQNYQLEIYTWDASGVLAGFPDLTTPVLLRPAWARMIRKNLAVELMPSLRMNLKIDLDAATRALVMKQAADSKAEVQSYQAPAPVLECDEAFTDRTGGAWNYLLGTTGPA